MNEIKSNYRIYNTTECIVFSKTNEKFGGLSNMAAGYPLFINDNIIPSTEALYQSMRYPLFPDIQFEIISQNSPMTAKMVSKKYYSQSRQDWDSIRIKVMRWCLEIKLLQNWSKFSKLLKETGNRPIVEFSKKDKFWGALPISDTQLGGTNALGRLLMDLRKKYMILEEPLKCLDPVNIYGFSLFNYPIETICSEEFYTKDTDFIQ